MSWRAIGLAVGGSVLGSGLVACGSEEPVELKLSSVAHPYDGPLDVKLSYKDRATVLERSGAAGMALECSTAPYNGGGGDYSDGGLESVQDDPESALSNLVDEEFFLTIPASGYEVERNDGDRVLFSYDVDGKTKAALVAADGIEDYNDNTGWGIEAWASCDPSELPDSVSDRYGVQVWTDANGQRVPVTEVTSYAGPEHCSWDDITFLAVDAGNHDTPHGTTYVRDVDGEFKGYLTTTFDDSAELPANATDTGWQHDDRALWLTPNSDAAYLVSTSDKTDVERWPAEKEPISCA